MKFRTTILQIGNNTGIVVPAAVVDNLGGGKKAAVVVTVGAFSYRSSIASMGGQFLISLSAERRLHSGLKGGDEIEVDLQLDTAPRLVDVPADLQAALAASAAAQAEFDRLSYSHKSAHVLAIEGAKTPETRQRRIDGAIAKLVAGKA
jgi:antitoxin component of MazEF toxin-antitoxin module